jgi:hypothetical protein
VHKHAGTYGRRQELKTQVEQALIRGFDRMTGVFVLGCLVLGASIGLSRLITGREGSHPDPASGRRRQRYRGSFVLPPVDKDPALAQPAKVAEPGGRSPR